MNLKIGDFVQIVDDTLEGVITKIKDDQVCVKDQDGFLHKYSFGQIVKIPQPLHVDTKDIEQIINQENTKATSGKLSSKELNTSLKSICIFMN